MILSDATAFIESLAQVKTSKEVGLKFSRFVLSYGFLAVACGGVRDTPEGLVYEFFFNTWPVEWLTHYQKNDYVRHDVVPVLARLTASPFTWQEALANCELTAKQIEHREWALKLGIVDTFVVPIHYPGGDYGLTAIISDHRIDNPEERLALQMASIYAHLLCRDFGDVTEATSVKVPLTCREIECLRWVLKGKSDTDIGSILNISPTTVHFHIERVKKKLGVKTRTQAATIVISLGYI